MAVCRVFVLLALVAVAQASLWSDVQKNWGSGDGASEVRNAVLNAYSGNVMPATGSSYGPVKAKSMFAWNMLVMGPHSATSMPVPGATNSTVTVTRTGLNTVYLAFESGDVSLNTTAMTTIPYMSGFVGTAEAAEDAVTVFGFWADTVDGSSLLMDVITRMMLPSEEVLHVVCTGDGGAGRLAMLCGPWAGLTYPAANVDVITFGGAWGATNSPFAWSFNTLVSLYYNWGYSSADVLLWMTAPEVIASPYHALGASISNLTTLKAITSASALNNLPPEMPSDWESDKGANLGSLGPSATNAEPMDSDCPPVICKARFVLNAACSLWPRNATSGSLLNNLPFQYLNDTATGAGGVVAWDVTTETAYFIWESTQNIKDALADLDVFLDDGFQPWRANVIPGTEVSRGFLGQFNAFVGAPVVQSNNITAVLNSLSGGVDPRRIVTGGHSLGSATSSMLGVWASGMWPMATVTCAGSGTPYVGNMQWTQEFRAVVGRAYRFVYELDIVPAAPPLYWYFPIDGAIWLREKLQLSSERPAYDFLTLSIKDHFCADGYIPQIMAARNVTVPSWIYTYEPTSYITDNLN